MDIIDMRIQPIFYESICKDKKELEFRMNSFGVFKQSPYPYEEILVEMDYAGVSRAALLPLDLTTTEGGWIVTNEQIAQIVGDLPERFIGFASVDPRRDDAVDVLEYAFETLELKGLSLAPQKQHFYPDEDNGAKKWVIVAHGYGGTQENSYYIAVIIFVSFNSAVRQNFNNLIGNRCLFQRR